MARIRSYILYPGISAPGFIAAALCAWMLLAPAFAPAENITYPSLLDPPLRNTDTVVPNYFSFPDSLFPTEPSNNTVTVHGTDMPGLVLGGISNDGASNGNAVTLNGGSAQGVYGGFSSLSAVTGNSVTISNGTVYGDVYGGRVFLNRSGSVSANEVVLNNTVVTGMIYGGRGIGGDAADNRVTVNGDSEAQEGIIGGFTQIGQGKAINNSVIVNDNVSVAGDVIGGQSAGDAIGNRVIFNGSRAYADIIGGQSSTGDAVGNSVTIIRGFFGDVNGGGAFVGEIVGGKNNGAGNAVGNSVTVKSGNMVDVYGGKVLNSGNASDNRVTFMNDNDTSTSVSGNVYGGYSSDGNATGNNVVISSSGELFGGNILVIGNVYGGVASSMATHNTVTLSGNPTIIGGLYGGFIGGGVGDAFTGNTLNVWNYSGSPVGSVQNFQFFNFRIPSTQSGPVLSVNGNVFLGDGAGKGSTVTGVNTNGGAPMPVGTNVTLIQAGTLNTTGFTQSQTQGQHDAILNYNWTLDTTTAPNSLIARLDNVQASPQAKALPEGRVSGVTGLNQSADHLAGKGIEGAVEAASGMTQGAKQTAKAGASAGYNFGTFSSVSAGSMRYHTGSYVDTSSLSLIAGLSFGADLAPGRLTLAPFFEYGTGSYNTYNSFSNAASVDGKGNMYHLGGGALARMDFLDTGPGHAYLEGSFRAGGVQNYYSNSDLRDDFGRRASYDSYSAYYGAHAGLGYLWNITEQASLDMYGKYFWTRQQGNSVTLSTGDPVKFKDVDSHRLRLGGRFAYAINDYVAPYIGAAYEREFDGKARATTYGYDMGAPSLRGDTGIGELGLTLKPSKNLPLSFDLGVQGYVGKREGVTGSVQIRYEF